MFRIVLGIIAIACFIVDLILTLAAPGVAGQVVTVLLYGGLASLAAAVTLPIP